MFVLAIIVIVVGTAYYATRDAEEGTEVVASVISLLIAVPIVFALLYLRLETLIDEKGILTWFKPFGFTKKYFSWEEVDKVYVRTYSPKIEYGGWGMRGVGDKDKAYIVKGKTGIQIVTNTGEKFLIGTMKPREAEKVVQQYKQISATYET